MVDLLIIPNLCSNGNRWIACSAKPNAAEKNRFISAEFGFALHAIPRFPLEQRFGIMSKSTISTFELFGHLLW
jgi:hypothetical protein